MHPLTKGQKFFFTVLGLAGGLVAAVGLLFPKLAAELFTWLVLPPLHAQFLGGVYLAGTVYAAGSLFVKRQAEARWTLHFIGIWTLVLSVVSLLHIPAFDFSRMPSWLWWIQYFLYAILAGWLITKLPKDIDADQLGGPALAPWAKRLLLAEGVVMTALAVLLFFTPGFVAAHWPWTITPMLAQIYSGSIAAIGIVSILSSRQATFAHVRKFSIALTVLGVATVTVSLLHRNLFSFGEAMTWVWFMWFACTAVAFGAVARKAMKSKE
jgi:hypothetical protein